ncbi:MAG: alpha/beta hydrolase, partial [Dehalococcoidales bacterium]|nr:alpha/beta hydrolase [Dehalococcoidales bacterium]
GIRETDYGPTRKLVAEAEKSGGNGEGERQGREGLRSIYPEFPCGEITLEGEWHLPQGEGPFPCVIVCHPHPLYGGNMSNNVVVAICQALPQKSIAAFRFNFRGVGNSGGSFGRGIREQEDVKAALDFTMSSPEIDTKRIGLAGYSFGASVALPVALQDERISLLALVSPALSDAGWEQLKGYSKSKFLMVGDIDFIISLERFKQCIGDVPDSKQYQVVSGADHFWWGYEQEVAQKVTQYFAVGFNQV